jgi:hypothetical protein
VPKKGSRTSEDLKAALAEPAERFGRPVGCGFRERKRVMVLHGKAPHPCPSRMSNANSASASSTAPATRQGLTGAVPSPWPVWPLTR